MEDFEQWLMNNVILKNRWTCPAEKCTFWQENELGSDVYTYKRLCNLFREWKKKKTRTRKAIKKAAVIVLFEITKRITKECFKLTAVNKEQANKLKELSEKHLQETKRMKAQIQKLLQDASHDAVEIDLKAHVKHLEIDLDYLNEECKQWKKKTKDVQAAFRVMKEESQEIISDHTECKEITEDLQTQLQIKRGVTS